MRLYLMHYLNSDSLEMDRNYHVCVLQQYNDLSWVAANGDSEVLGNKELPSFSQKMLAILFYENKISTFR